MKTFDVAIIGGGIMGQMTAYYASEFNKKIALIEKGNLNNPDSASWGITRSIRSDYIEKEYAQFSEEARLMWKDIEKKSGERVLIPCGCLNLISNKFSPNRNTTYAIQAYQTMKDLGLDVIRLRKTQLDKKFPQFVADEAVLDSNAGLLFLPGVQAAMKKFRVVNNINIYENQNIEGIRRSGNIYRINFGKTSIRARSIVIAAGIWTNDVLNCFTGYTRKLPISKARPENSLYFIPSTNNDKYSSEKMPVFAYLDFGIYGHPIVLGETKGIKIGIFNPSGFKRGNAITSIEEFVQECMPDLTKMKSIRVKDADTGYYQMVPDNEFILGEMPDLPNVYVGAGWKGTGYKFAPLIGKILTQLSLQGKTVFNIDQFSPSRFSL